MAEQKKDLSQIFQTMDWACLFREEEKSGLLTVVLPIASAVISLVILIVVLFKVK